MAESARLTGIQRNELFVLAGQIMRDIEVGATSFADAEEGLRRLGRIDWQAISLTWKTIYLGVASDLLASFHKAKGVSITEGVLAYAYRGNVIIAPRFHPLPLIRVTPRQLGFTSLATFGAVRKRINDNSNLFRLLPCPQETPFRLRMQYTDQPKGENLLVISDPWDDGGLPRICVVGCGSAQECDEGLYLYEVFALDDGGLDLDIPLIFQRGD